MILARASLFGSEGMNAEKLTIKLTHLLEELKDNGEHAACLYQVSGRDTLQLATLAWDAVKDDIDGLGEGLSLTLRMAYGEVWRFNTVLEMKIPMADFALRASISLALAEQKLSAYLGMNPVERFRGCLLGLAVGDAVGTTVEFRQRGTFEPLTDMVGGGPFNLLPGQWTDDTSMALCLATSLVEQRGIDPADQMSRYCRWADHGYLSSTGTCFDIGTTTVRSLRRFQRDGNPYAGSSDPTLAGNGCIMRLAPIPMYFCPHLEIVERCAADSSRTTHGAEECIDACRLFARIVCRALLGRSKDEVLLGDADSFAAAESVTAIARGSYRSKEEADIHGSGYVVHSLEAALWVFDRTHNFADAILLAANLGEDADTTAAVCGQLAGAYYGESAIPSHWLERLALRSEITKLADQLRCHTQWIR
jgi:ADP-ribosyl-[dinitrogen reductase] hydrolase